MVIRGLGSFRIWREGEIEIAICDIVQFVRSWRRTMILFTILLIGIFAAERVHIRTCDPRTTAGEGGESLCWGERGRRQGIGGDDEF